MTSTMLIKQGCMISFLLAMSLFYFLLSHDDREPPAPVPFLQAAEPIWLEGDFIDLLLNISNANGGAVVTTTINFGHLNMTLNWVENMRRLDVGFIIFCIDNLVLQELLSRNVTAVLIPDAWLPWYLRDWRRGAFTKEAVWLTKDYNYVTHFKAPVVRYLLSRGFRVVFSDVDVAWVKPGVVEHLLEQAEQHPGAFIMSTRDQDQTPYFKKPYVNSGMYLMIPCQKSVYLMQRTIEQQEKVQGVMDQDVVNRVLEKMGSKENGDLWRLEDCLFPNGWRYFLGNGGCPKDVVPYIAHANYMVGRDAKEKALRKAGLWYLE